MTGLYDMLGDNPLLSSLKTHSNCHAVIDGSNLLYSFSLRKHALSNFSGYDRTVRNFFQRLLDAGITPHVFFDGPSRNDPYKWERGRLRRQERLQKLVHGTTNFRVLDYPQPTAIVDVFRDVLHSLGIRSIQVSAKRDYTLEMVSHAKHLNAFLISGNAKFFVEDIPRGFVFVQREAFGSANFEIGHKMKTFKFKKLSELIGLEHSPNPYALIMWVVVLYNRKTFELFTRPFFGKARNRPEHYPQSSTSWVETLVSERSRKFPLMKVLQFFLERTQADAEAIIRGQLYPGERKEAALFFEQSISAQLVEPHDVFEKIEEQIETGNFCDEDLPKWFLRYLTVECKMLPSVMDILTGRRNQLVSFLENFEKKSVNESTLRLRRIIYGILFSETEDRVGVVKVAELDRIADSLEETEQMPMRFLWNPESPSEKHEVPGLKKIEFLTQSERIELFLLSMGAEENLLREVDSKEAMYVLIIMRYWIIANDDVGRKDLIRILLTALMVEQKYSKTSNIFKNAVQLNEDASCTLGIRFEPDSVPQERESFACMHPHSLLQNATLFGRVLHRLLMQPLGATVDAIEAVTSEVVFYHVHRRTRCADDDELKYIVGHAMDEKNKKNFWETVDLIWDEKAIIRGRNIMRDFRAAGDQPRP